MTLSKTHPNARTESNLLRNVTRRTLQWLCGLRGHRPDRSRTVHLTDSYYGPEGTAYHPCPTCGKRRAIRAKKAS